MPRNNYIKYKSYLIRFYNNNNFNKKIYKKLKYHVNINNTQMLAKQLPILSDADTYDIESVIYAIIYLPSSRVYVGQTIRSSFHRFKKHFSDANNHDSKNCHLHKLMLRDRNLYNYFLWPLEYIDPTFYEHSDNSTSRKRFRSYANQRELFWIRKLKSLSPRGLNAVLPY